MIILACLLAAFAGTGRGEVAASEDREPSLPAT